MSVTTASVGITIPKRSFHQNNVPHTSYKASPQVEKFYEKYHSFKAGKALAANDKEEILSVFNFFDENHDGLISKDDLRHFLGRLGILVTDDNLAGMMSSVDSNGDGSVDFKEFASLYQKIANEELFAEGDEAADEDLQKAFDVFDKNADGLISATELQEVLVTLGMEVGKNIMNCEKMIEKFDSNQDGKVDFGDFKKMMTGPCDKGGS